MAEMKIRNGPLRIKVLDDSGRTLASLRYPKVKWGELVIEAADGELEVEALDRRTVRVARKVEETEAAENDGDDPLRAARQLGESLDILVRDFAKGVKDLLGL